MSEDQRLDRRLIARFGEAMYAWENEIAEYVRARGFPVVCWAFQRHRLKRLLRELERTHTGLKRSLLGALGRVDPGSLPISARRGARPGNRLPLLAGAAGMTLAAALGLGDGTR